MRPGGGGGDRRRHRETGTRYNARNTYDYYRQRKMTSLQCIRALPGVQVRFAGGEKNLLGENVGKKREKRVVSSRSARPPTTDYPDYGTSTAPQKRRTGDPSPPPSPPSPPPPAANPSQGPLLGARSASTAGAVVPEAGLAWKRLARATRMTAAAVAPGNLRRLRRSG